MAGELMPVFIVVTILDPSELFKVYNESDEDQPRLKLKRPAALAVRNEDSTDLGAARKKLDCRTRRDWTTRVVDSCRVTLA